MGIIKQTVNKAFAFAHKLKQNQSQHDRKKEGKERGGLFNNTTSIVDFSFIPHNHNQLSNDQLSNKNYP